MQELTLGHKMDKYKIKHLFMHTIGFYHEHNRPDRDQNVEISWDNIQESSKPFFNKRKFMEKFNISYDFNSIMHYPENAFSNHQKRNGNDGKTIKPLVSNKRFYSKSTQKRHQFVNF